MYVCVLYLSIPLVLVYDIYFDTILLFIYKTKTTMYGICTYIFIRH